MALCTIYESVPHNFISSFVELSSASESYDYRGENLSPNGESVFEIRDTLLLESTAVDKRRIFHFIGYIAAITLVAICIYLFMAEWHIPGVICVIFLLLTTAWIVDQKRKVKQINESIAVLEVGDMREL